MGETSLRSGGNEAGTRGDRKKCRGSGEIKIQWSGKVGEKDVKKRKNQ